jgi:hypothetical protein
MNKLQTCMDGRQSGLGKNGFDTVGAKISPKIRVRQRPAVGLCIDLPPKLTYLD